MKKTLKITDVDYSFRDHPITGNLVLKSGPDAINQSVKTLVLLNIFEKPFSTISGNISNKLFEQMNFTTETKIQEEIKTLLATYEKRVEVQDVLVEQKENALNIGIYYIIIGEDLPTQEITIEVSRSR